MCLLDYLTPALYCVLIFVVIFFINKFSKRNKSLYDETLVRQKAMMERQKESIELLREIRDLLKKNSN